MNSLASTTLRGLAAGAVITALSAAAFAGPAAAETRIFPDARGDIAHGADIYRVRVANGAEMVRIKVVHRNLRRTFRSGSSLTVFLDTDRRDRGPEYVFSGGTFEGSDYALAKTDGWRLADRANQPMRCDYDMKLDYVKETALVRISRSCLGNPHAVRVAVKTGGEHVNKAGETTKIEVDWLGKPRQFTPWVKRG